MVMTSSFPVVIIGAGGHALVVADILQLMARFRIVGFLDEVNPQRRGEPFGPARVLGGMDELEHLLFIGMRHAIVAIGHCATRMRISRTLTEAGFELITVVHPCATIASGVELGVGSAITANAVINPGAKLGENVIINTGATVDHECEVGSGVHVGAGVHLAGRVKVGERAWIGIGSTVIECVTIGADAYIGAGAVVLKDIPPGMLAYGVPAQIIKEVNP